MNKDNVKNNILLVDDDENIIKALRRQLRTESLHLHTAGNVSDAQIILQDNDIDLLISDVRLKTNEGLDFLEFCQVNWPDMLKILLTGYTNIDSAVNAINKGRIHQYLTKPWEQTDLIVSVKNALAFKKLEHDKKQLVQTITEKNNELNNQVLALEQKETQLKQAKDQLEKLSIERLNFFSTLNHEIDTVIGAVYSLLMMLNETQLTSVQEDYVLSIQESNDIIISILNDVLDVIHLESNDLKFDKLNFCLDFCLRDLKEHYEQLFSKFNYNVSIQPRSQQAWIKTDPTRIKHAIKKIMEVLLENSVDKKLEVLNQIISDRADTYCIEISIKYRGIPPENFIFEKELDANVMNFSKQSFNNIGLLLAHKIVSLMDGKISIESKSPYQLCNIKFFAQKGTAFLPNKGKDFDISKLRVLSISDRQIIQKHMKSLFQECGIKDFYFIGSESVKEMLDELPNYDLIILSSAVTEVDIFELIKEVNSRLTDQSRIILFAIKTYRGHARLSKDCGVDAYLTRPITDTILTKAAHLAFSLEKSADTPLITKYSLEGM